MASKAETAQRLKFITAGMWDDRILVFPKREIWSKTCTVLPDGKVQVVGKDRETQLSVNEVIDPNSVTRIC